MHYTVTSQGNRQFEVFSEDNDSLGVMNFSPWRFFNKGEITTVNHLIYKIAPKGFWQTTLAITKQDMPFAEIKLKLGMRMVLSFANENRVYYFKKKGFWNSNYILTDEDDHEIAFIEVSYNWRKWKFDYSIDVHANMLDKEANLLLPLILVLCARNMRMRQAAAT